jgi:hypothetical protein
MRYQSRTREKELFLKRVKIYVASGAAILLLIGFFSFIFHFPLFTVQNVSVSGNSVVSSATIISAVNAELLRHGGLNSWLGLTNMWSWGGSAQVSGAALKFMPGLSGLKIERDFFSRRVVIKVSERPKTLLWCFTASGSCYWTDRNGRAFSRAASTSSSATPAASSTSLALIDIASSTSPEVVDSSRPNIPLLSTTLPAAQYGNLLAVATFLEKLGFSNPVLYLDNLSYEEVYFKTPDNKKIYFSLLFDPSDDLGAVQSLLKDPAWKSIQYIDLRVQGRIYYK